MRRAIATHWQADHPILNPALFAWQYRGYGDADDGAPWAFVAVDDHEVISFVGLIPGMVRHVRAGGSDTRPQALIALWFTAEQYRSAGVGVLLLREAGRQLEILGSLGVNPRARQVLKRLGFGCGEDLERWVVPLGAGYRLLLREPSAVDPGAVDEWSARTMNVDPAAPSEFDPGALAALCAPTDIGGLDRTAAFYAWRYQQSVGFTYHALDSHAGKAIVRIEEPRLDGAGPVLRVLEFLPHGDPTQLVASVLTWGRTVGCCAADYQVSRGDRLEPALQQAGFERVQLHLPHTALAEMFRPYRPDASRINVVFRPDEHDVGPWRFLKSDGDMDRTNEPYRTSLP